MTVIWSVAIAVACLLPLTFPAFESAAFYHPAAPPAPEAFDFLALYIPTNPFHALANNIVPAVVLFSVVLGLALIGVEQKQPLLAVLHTATAAVGRIARFIVRLTPYGVFAIAAHAAGTLDLAQIQRLEVFLVAYVAFSLVLSLWVLPGLIGVLTPIGAVESLSASRDSLLTAFLVGDLFVVLPSLIETCEALVARHINSKAEVRELPGSIVPTSFTFPHAGKLLSISFVLFAGWFSDSLVPLTQYPKLALSGFFSFFGSMNAAVPFLLDQFRIPADTFQLFLATGVINARFGTLLAAVHTLAVGLIGSAAIAGAVRLQPAKLVRFVVTTGVVLAVVIVGLRAGFTAFINLTLDGRALVYAMQPLAFPAVDDRNVLAPADVGPASIPPADQILQAIQTRGRLRVGIIGDGIPYAFRNDRQQLLGLDVEMAQRLAADLGVGLEFVRFPMADLDHQVQARTIDIVMTGVRLTPRRAAAFTVSDVYLEETLGIVTRDERRREFESWDSVRRMGAVRLGVRNLPYYIGEIKTLLPAARLSVIEETPELIDPAAPYDAYVLAAERGSVLTMFHPRYSVVVPQGATIRMPLVYPLAGNDAAWLRYVNTWVGLKKRDGFIDALYEQWIRGRAAAHPRPRWSVVRDVLHWVP